MQPFCKRFAKNDTGFTCINCGISVVPLGSTSRDHCTACLYGLHVDINPGDRASDCHGILVPMQITPDTRGGYVIHFLCLKCGAKINNKAADDDNFEEILRICKSQQPQL